MVSLCTQMYGKKKHEKHKQSQLFISEAASGQCVSQHLPTQFSDHDPSCMGGQVFGLSSRIASSGKGRIFGPSLSAYLAAVSDGKPQSMTNITTMSEIHGFGVLLWELEAICPGSATLFFGTTPDLMERTGHQESMCVYINIYICTVYYYILHKYT